MDINRIRELAGLEAVKVEEVLEVDCGENCDAAEEIVELEEVSVEEVQESIQELEEVDEKVKGSDSDEKPSVPAAVTKAISTRIAELKDAINRFDEKGYNDGSVKQDAIDALEQIADNLKQENGITKANIFFNKQASMIQDLIPPAVVKFIHGA